MTEIDFYPAKDFAFYDVYRALTDKHYKHAEGVRRSINMLNDKRFNDADNRNMLSVYEQDGEDKLNWGIGGYENLVLPLYREGIALARIFGSALVEEKMGEELAAELRTNKILIDNRPIISGGRVYYQTGLAQDEFDRRAGVLYVFAALTIIRAESALKLAFESGQITEEKFKEGVAVINKQMDKAGFNGIDRMMEARPELEEAFVNDKRMMDITPEHLKRATKGHTFPPYPDYVYELLEHEHKKMERSRYYVLMRDNICKDPFLKKELVQNMMGEDYAKAFNHRIKTHQANDHVHISYQLTSFKKLMDIIQHGEGESFDQALKMFYINYGLGGTAEQFQSYGVNPAGNADVAQDNLIEDQKKTTGPGVSESPTLLPPLKISTLGLPGMNRVASNTNKDGTAASPTESYPDSATPGETITNPTINPPIADNTAEPKHKNFVTAGKIGTTTVLAAGLFDGVYNLFKSDKDDPDKPKSKGKIFIRAIEVAAAIAGIVLIWKSKTVHSWFNNVLGQGPQSA